MGEISTNGTSAATSDSNVLLSTYSFWLILACSAIFTFLVLLVSYAICRYRKPGCADAAAARERFLEENIIAAHQRLHHQDSFIHTHPPRSSSTSTSTTPGTGHTPAASPDLLVHHPNDSGVLRARVGIRRGATIATGIATAPAASAAISGRKSMIPVKIPSSGLPTINRAFILGAAAFSSKAASAASAVPALQRVQECDVTSCGQAAPLSGAASPRMVQLGGFRPRVKLKDAGRTESKQTILSSDAESLTVVGT